MKSWTTFKSHWPCQPPQWGYYSCWPPQQSVSRRFFWGEYSAEDTGQDVSEKRFEESDNQAARVEAVLFLARQPLPARKIAQIAGLDSGIQVRALVRRLNKLYDENRMAFRVTEVAGGFQLRTRAGFEPWIARLVKDPDLVRLSPPAMETLAVIAYRQPILRAEIESIRGVQCGEVVRQLLERGLIRIVGRSEELGRPYLYGTSSRFLEMFGLRGLDDLPHSEYRIPSVTTGPAPGQGENG